ncbi:MAG: hypothetical protein M1819_002909 [Sarea resinae]|nr:MAG: hypothetical protein M1819_002909 [Sarea resinae]
MSGTPQVAQSVSKCKLSKNTSETAREREVYKYYQPLYVAPDLAGIRRAPRSSWDASLTAFAQLGALRLNAKRCLISLVTRDTSYVIAEATRTISLQADGVHDEGDHLWFGVATVSKTHGLCSHTVDLFVGNDDCEAEYGAIGDDGKVNHVAVNDLLEDRCNRRREMAKRTPGLRFYASVPITTKAGYIIGAYSLVDDSPRDGITSIELAFLKDMANTIMDHLAVTRAKSQHYRAEKMVKAMGLFVEEGSSLREWWLRTGHEASTRKAENGSYNEPSLDEQADFEFGVQDAPEGFGTSTIANLGTQEYTASASSRRPFQSESGSALTSMESDITERILSTEPHQTSQATSITTGIARSVYTPYSQMQPATESATKSGANAVNTMTNATDIPGSQLQEAILSPDLKHTFARASNLIREALAISGALFLDASVGSFAGRSGKATMNDTAPSAFAHGSAPCTTPSSDEERGIKGSLVDLDGRASSSGTAPLNSKTCGILGYSTNTRSSLNMHKASELHSTVSESFLRKLLKRYPHGKIFNLDADGTVSSSDDEGAKFLHIPVAEKVGVTPTRKTKRKALSKEAEFKTILEILPGARSIAFFPLWDSHKERWFAGGFLWTTQPARVFAPEDELTFFAAFSNSIMAEVARLDALVAGQMKVNFISSISHELRSPLHGILASVELLQDSEMDTTQADLAKTIDACGKILLDTINHVLDFTKVNSKARQKARKSRKKPKVPREHLDKKTTLDSENISTIAPDISVLTEEVVSGVYAGHHHRKCSTLDMKSQHSQTNSDGLNDCGTDRYRNKSDKMAVIIILNISLRENFRFAIEAGAWRRIIMNLFGNALKYTADGFIHVSLHTKDEVSKDGYSRSFVTLSVSDSGQGLSREFLQNRLYTPFAQEDSLSVGTGLGLSIVRQIVADLEGSIEFNSEKGNGTEAVITLPMLTPSRTFGSDAPLGRDIESARNRTRGLRACFVSFDVTPDMDDTSGILSTEAERMFALKTALSSILEDWFQMLIISSTTMSTSLADIYLIMGSDFNDLKASGYFDHTDQDLEKSLGRSHLPILLVLSSMDSNMEENTAGGYNVINLQLPLGPHKLANVFSRCLSKRNSSWEASLPSSSLSSPLKTVSNISSSISKSETSTTRIPRLTVQQTHCSPLRRESTASTSRREYKAPSTDIDKQSYDPDFSLPNVLLVEDNEINLKLLVTYMRRLHVPHAIAVNGLEALQSYQSTTRSFDIVLMDISMPIMDGLTSSREIRSFERVNDIPPATLIALTGAASPAARQEAFASGVDRYFTKPVPLRALKTILDEFQIRKQEKRGVERSGKFKR